MKKGIIIYAIGHSNYYRMAEVLAASLICNGSKKAGIDIALICDCRDKIDNPQLFDDIIDLDPEVFMVDGNIVFNNATIRMYELSPFDITMKLDADMIWIPGRSVGDLFDTLKDVDITFQNRGHGWGNNNSVWAEEDDIKKKYKITEDEKLYKIYGEFVYFKKCETVEKYFKEAIKVYRAKKVKCSPFSNGNFTDELAFQIACMIMGIYPHLDNFCPIFNQFLEYPELSRKYPYELELFYGYSVGGHQVNAFRKQNYDVLATHYYNTLGLTSTYELSNKNSYLPERKKL